MLATPRKSFGSTGERCFERDLKALTLTRPISAWVDVAIDQPVSTSDCIELPLAFTVKDLDECLYRNALFLCTLKVPHNFPFKPPSVFVRNPVLHPNVHADSNEMTLRCLQHELWLPVVSLKTVVEAIQNVLIAPDVSCLPDTPLNQEMAQTYTERPAEFRAVIREILQGREFAGRVFPRYFGQTVQKKRKRSTDALAKKYKKLSCV